MNKIHSVLRNLLCINTRNNSTISRLRNDCQIVYKQLPSTKSNISIVCHNARSLRKHIDEYRNDARLQQVDFIFILETWAQRCDPLEYYRLRDFILLNSIPINKLLIDHIVEYLST